MAFQLGMSWHSGETAVQRLMKVPELDNPTSPMLTPQAANMLQRAPLLAVGTLDSSGNPWTTVWGGQPPLSQPLGQSMIGIRANVTKSVDPVVQALFEGQKRGDDADLTAGGKGKMVAGLTIDLQTRKRVKVYGRMVAGGLVEKEDKPEETQAQLVIRVDQSLGNCPKYLNRKAITEAQPKPEVVLDDTNLDERAQELIGRSDLFFVSSVRSKYDMDANHRGGPKGFVRTFVDHSTNQSHIVWPEYSGNRFYQTLGNMYDTPRAGLVFPDFATGDVLYVTGSTEILIGPDAAEVIPRSNLAVRLTVTRARLVQEGLAFRGEEGEASPYNPRVRPLASEKVLAVDAKPDNRMLVQASLQNVDPLTPTITRYSFSTDQEVTWEAGGWVALDFSNELDIGYSHMREDDPTSLNDDFVRTFTVSQPPKKDSKEFEITIRRVGVATDFLSRQKGGGRFQLPVKGFGGGLKVIPEKKKKTGFVVGGVGITPLLGQMAELNPKDIELYWLSNVDDVGLIVYTLSLHPELGENTTVFLTGNKSKLEAGKKVLMDAGIKACETRRITKEDLQASRDTGHTWHACVSGPVRKILLEWLKGKEVLYEDFNF